MGFITVELGLLVKYAEKFRTKWDRLQDTEAAHAAQSKTEAIQEAADFLYQGTTWHRGMAVSEGGRLLQRISI